MTILSQEMGAASGVIQQIDPEVMTELRKLAEEYNADTSVIWGEKECALMLEFFPTVTRRGMVVILKKFAPDKHWNVDMVRAKARRMGLLAE